MGDQKTEVAPRETRLVGDSRPQKQNWQYVHVWFPEHIEIVVG